MLAGLAAKFTPSLNRAFVRLTFLGSIVVGLLAALVSDHGLAIEALLGLALVAGTAGYSMRLRGFSLRQYTDRTAAAMQRAREVGAPTRLALPIARYITYVSASTAMRTTMMIM